MASGYVIRVADSPFAANISPMCTSADCIGHQCVPAATTAALPSSFWTYRLGGLIDFSENDLKLDLIRPISFG